MYELTQDKVLKIDSKLRELLRSVQTKGNLDISYQTDLKSYNVLEKWAYPKEQGMVLVGDCEDYCIYKHKLLTDAGVPKDPLLMTICKDPSGNGHCVLCACTDEGDYILCNNHDSLTTVRAMRHEGYKFLYRQRLGLGIDADWDVLK